MSITRSSKKTAMTCLAIVMFACHVANATPPATRKPNPIFDKPASPYSLTLSLSDNWNITPTGLPRTTVTFVNSGSYTLTFFLTSALSSITVEYKKAKDDLASSTGWKVLKPNHQLSPAVASPEKPTASSTFDVLMNFSPKQEDKTEYDLDNFSMSAEGFYRILAFTKLSSVSELDGPVASPTVVRTFTLDIHSNSIIIQRTSKGFVEVSQMSGKQPPAK